MGTVPDRRELTAAEAALVLGISRERVIRLVQVGALRGRRDEQLGWRVATDAEGRPTVIAQVAS